jgi:hypothetical protein
VAKQHDDLAPKGYHWVYSPYITLKGKRIYPKRAKVFRFLAKD